jgi:hypothetical protein
MPARSGIWVGRISLIPFVDTRGAFDPVTAIKPGDEPAPRLMTRFISGGRDFSSSRVPLVPTEKTMPSAVVDNLGVI